MDFVTFIRKNYFKKYFFLALSDTLWPSLVIRDYFLKKCSPISIRLKCMYVYFTPFDAVWNPSHNINLCWQMKEIRLSNMKTLWAGLLKGNIYSQKKINFDNAVVLYMDVMKSRTWMDEMEADCCRRFGLRSNVKIGLSNGFKMNVICYRCSKESFSDY